MEATPVDTLLDEVAFYKELAHLRGELIGALMSGNNSLGAYLLPQIEKLLSSTKEFPAGRAPSVHQKQNLKDALAKITNAVNQILD